MEWNDIITAIASLISGGAISAIATLGITRQKAKADVEQVRANTFATTTDNNIASLKALNGVIDGLNKQLNAEQDDNLQKSKRINELYDEVVALRSECTTKGQYMCVHLGCECRKPSLGRGDEWYSTHSKKDNFGGDFVHVEELRKLYNTNQIKQDNE